MIGEIRQNFTEASASPGWPHTSYGAAAVMIGHVLYVFATSSIYAPEINLRHCEKT